MPSKLSIELVAHDSSDFRLVMKCDGLSTQRLSFCDKRLAFECMKDYVHYAMLDFLFDDSMGPFNKEV